LRWFQKSLRFAILGFVLTYFVVASGLLAVRYVLLPKLNDWRPNLESQLSQTLGADVKINHLRGQWRGLNPSAEVDGLSITFPGQPPVEIPQISAVLSWKSLFLLEPTLLDLYVQGLSLTVSQAPDGDFSFQGISLAKVDTRSKGVIDNDSAINVAALNTEHTTKQNFNIDQFLQNPAWLWLKQQGQISLVNSTLIWKDQKRQAPDLVLRDLNINLQNTLLSHRLNIKFTPPDDLSKPIEVGVKIGRLLNQIGAALPGGRDGEMFVSAPDFNLQAWQPWFDVPAVAGQFAARIWFDLKDRRLNYVTLDFVGSDVSVINKDINDSVQPFWSIGRFTSRIEGAAASIVLGLPMPDIFSTDVDSKNIIFKLQSTNLHLALSEKAQPITDILSLDLNLSIARQSIDDISVQINQSNIKTANGSASILGNWRTSNQSVQGIADLTGQISHLNLPDLYRYLPPSIDADAFAWVSRAFKTGVIEQATFLLKGPLAEYPFAKGSNVGQFKFSGLFSDLKIDFVPDAIAGEKWPLFKSVRGTLNIEQDHLSVLANLGQLVVVHAEKEYEIGVQNLRIDVGSMGTHPTVSVVTQTSGAASNYLNLIKHSALATLLPPELSKVSADGFWELPYTFNLLIEKPKEATFGASLLFKQNTVQYDGITLAKQLTGQANFSQNGMKTNNLTGIVLGGSALIKGDLSAEHIELLVNGEMSTAGISEFTDSPLMGLLKGQFAYQAKLEQLASKQLKATFETKLKGVAINLPAPLGKTANTEMPLSLQWFHNDKNKTSAGNIDLKIGSLIKAWGVLNAADAAVPMPILNQFSVGIGREPDKTAKGVSVAAQLSKVDPLRWQSAYTLLMQEIDRPVIGRPLMPDISTVRLSTPLVQVSDKDYQNVSLALTRSNPNNWTVDVGAKTLSGSIRWETQAGNIRGPITVNFPKLEIGDSAAKKDDILEPVAVVATTKNAKNLNADANKASAAENNILESDFWRKIDFVNIRVDNLVLFGNHVGSLNLNAVPQLEDRRWKINDLNINTPHGELKSNGFLRVDGDRGVDLGIKANVTNLGKLLTYVGYPDRILNGAGVMEANIDWVEFPWSTDPAGLSGSAQVNLKSGVFEHVNSRSARLLEILSLQSLKRFFSLDVNADNTFKSGFPWGSIEGDFVIDKGNVNSQNLIIESPVAEIALVGDTNMVRQDWNVKASVKPQLDFSGTAIATGFVLNPIVGLSALIGQYILKNPIERALQAQYYVTGPWDDPKVNAEGSTESTKSDSALNANGLNVPSTDTSSNTNAIPN